ncbi:MAG: peptidylprolyl isomerase [Brevinema sp.]
MHFIKHTILCVSTLLVVSCSSNQKIVSYKDLSAKTVDVSFKQALERLESSFSGATPEQIASFASDRELFKKIIASSIVDIELYIMEAAQVSNFLQDELYLDSIKQQKLLLPYYLASEAGKEQISKIINKSKIDVAKVYQIMFTNKVEGTIVTDEPTKTTPEQILEQLKASSNIIDDFTLSAKQYSEEPIGAQTGGDLGYVQKGMRTDIDDVLFKKKVKGLYPQIIEGKFGKYILYIEEKAKTITFEEAQENNIYVATDKMLTAYFNKNIKINFSILEDKMIVGNKTNLISEFPTQTKIVTIFGKKYSFDDLLLPMQAQGLVPVGVTADFETMIKGFISPVDMTKPSQLLYNLALTLKGYKSSIKNTHKFKKIQDAEMRSLAFQTAVPILSDIVFKDLVTNITDQEARKAYNEQPVEQRPITGFNDQDQPIYATFAEAKDEIKQRIISDRARMIQETYRSTLDEKYHVVWNEKALDKLMAKIQKNYGVSDQISSLSSVEEIVE